MASYCGPLVNTWSGLEKLNIFDKPYCKRLISIMENDWEQTNNLQFNRTVLEAILTPNLTDRLRGFFGCNFIPQWMRWYKNDSIDPERPYAFYWHCDGGPRAHLKLLLYLNSSQVSGGNTLFLSREQTKAFEEIGYVFCNIDHRLSDLTPLSEKFMIGYDPIDYRPLSGDAILFEPSRILHKGIWPKVRKRYMIQLLFIPSMLPWEEMKNLTDLPVESNAYPDLRNA